MLYISLIISKVCQCHLTGLYDGLGIRFENKRFLDESFLAFQNTCESQ